MNFVRSASGAAAVDESVVRRDADIELPGMDSQRVSATAAAPNARAMVKKHSHRLTQRVNKYQVYCKRATKTEKSSSSQ